MSKIKEQIAEDKLDIFSISWITIACVIGVVVITLFGEALYFRMQRHEDQKKAEMTVYRELELITAEQILELNSTGWVDRDQNLVRIPIDEAMKLVVERTAAGEPLLPALPIVEVEAPVTDEAPAEDEHPADVEGEATDE